MSFDDIFYYWENFSDKKVIVNDCQVTSKQTRFYIQIFEEKNSGRKLYGSAQMKWAPKWGERVIYFGAIILSESKKRVKRKTIN